MVQSDPTRPRALVCLLTAALCLLAGGAAAENEQAGDFDFYVLSLAWSPTYCATDDDPDESQCEVRPRGFVLHGLWPQYERGYPEFCMAASPRRLSSDSFAGIADLMPSRGLAQHQWEKHGRCSGLDQDAYFALMRRAFERVVIPLPLRTPAENQMVAPRAIEAAFIAANPGLSPRDMGISCNRDGLKEIRICLGKDLGFRSCAEVDSDGCHSYPTLMRGVP